MCTGCATRGDAFHHISFAFTRFLRRRWLTPLMRHPQDERERSARSYTGVFILHCKHARSSSPQPTHACVDLLSYTMVTRHVCLTWLWLYSEEKRKVWESSNNTSVQHLTTVQLRLFKVFWLWHYFYMKWHSCFKMLENVQFYQIHTTSLTVHTFFFHQKHSDFQFIAI